MTKQDGRGESGRSDEVYHRLAALIMSGPFDEFCNREVIIGTLALAAVSLQTEVDKGGADPQGGAELSKLEAQFDALVQAVRRCLPPEPRAGATDPTSSDDAAGDDDARPAPQPSAERILLEGDAVNSAYQNLTQLIRGPEMIDVPRPALPGAVLHLAAALFAGRLVQETDDQIDADVAYLGAIFQQMVIAQLGLARLHVAEPASKAMN
ncbi:MAG: hypothetical protein OXE84_07740 [Rhodobacteraceae bacterium]|nr:hypothetical protein [Paracoccaceae bacterium]